MRGSLKARVNCQRSKHSAINAKMWIQLINEVALFAIPSWEQFLECLIQRTQEGKALCKAHWISIVECGEAAVWNSWHTTKSASDTGVYCVRISCRGDTILHQIASSLSLRAFRQLTSLIDPRFKINRYAFTKPNVCAILCAEFFAFAQNIIKWIFSSHSQVRFAEIFEYRLLVFSNEPAIATCPNAL